MRRTPWNRVKSWAEIVSNRSIEARGVRACVHEGRWRGYAIWGMFLAARTGHDAVMAHTEMNLANSDVSRTVESELPTGTVTFLLTDIEGSTKLWEAGADETAVSVARHYELLDAADRAARWRAARSSRVRATAWSARSRGRRTRWPRRSTCNARSRRNRGPPVGKCVCAWRSTPARSACATPATTSARRSSGARVCARSGTAARRSSPTPRAIWSSTRCPTGPSSVISGLHRLKDLGRAERIWQLVHPDLGHEFPPLRSLGAMPTNLPAQVSSFVGRDAEIAAVREAVRENRLVTLTGTGGCGKTRLALHAAADELDLHPDGVWCAELAAVAHGSDIAEAIAGVFGLREEFGRPLIDTLTEQLHDLDALLVVDNCEQVLDAAAADDRIAAARVPALARAGHESRADGCRGRGGVACPVARPAPRRSRCSWSERNRRDRDSRPTPKHRRRSTRSSTVSTAFRSRSSSRRHGCA